MKLTARVLAIALALALAGCKGGEPPQQGQRKRMERPPAAVTVVPVATRTLAETLALTGTLEAERQVAVAPRAQGRLVEVAVQLGDAVRAGQVIARLDDADMRARLEQAKAALAASRASLSQRRLEHANMARQAERQRELLAQDFIARQDYENAKTAADSARVMVELATSEIARQQAAVREAQEAFEQTVLRAPMAGVVAARHLDPGAIATTSAPVVTIVAPGALKSVVAVPESSLPRLKPGTPASVAVDAWPDDRFEARLTRVAPVVSPETRMGQIELKVEDPAGKLRAGMFARVAVTLAERKDVPAIPRAALVTQGGAQGVFVPREGQARFVPVRLGLADATHAEVLEGPASGTPVVTEGAAMLKDGAAVQTGDRKAGGRRKEEHGGSR